MASTEERIADLVGQAVRTQAEVKRMLEEVHAVVAELRNGIVTEHLAIVHECGRTTGLLQTSPKGGGLLRMYDQAGQLRAFVSADIEDTVLGLCDRQERRVAALTAGGSSGRANLVNLDSGRSVSVGP